METASRAQSVSCGGCPACASLAQSCPPLASRQHAQLCGPVLQVLLLSAYAGLPGTHIPPCWHGLGSWVSCLHRRSCGPDRHSSPVRERSGHRPAGALPGQQQQHLQQHNQKDTSSVGAGRPFIWSSRGQPAQPMAKWVAVAAKWSSKQALLASSQQHVNSGA